MANWASTRWGRGVIFSVVACTVGGSVVAVNEGWMPWQSESEGQLQVRVGSLPVGKIGDVTVRGPEGMTEHVTRTSTLTGVKPGRYTITAGRVRGTDHDLYPPTVEQTATVPAGGRASVTVDYNTVIPHTTKPVDAVEIREVDGDSVTLAPGSATARKLAVGDVLVAGVGPDTPEGLLRKVTEVRTSGGEVTAATQPTTLREAVPQGRLNIVDAPVMSLEEAMRREGTATARHAAFTGPVRTANLLAAGAATGDDPELEVDGEGGFSFLHNFADSSSNAGADKDDSKRGEGSLACAGGGSLPLLMEAAFTATTPRMTLDTSWDHGRQKGVRWALNASQRAGFGAESNNVEAKCDVRWLYPKKPIRLGVITVSLGSVPVAITVKGALTGVAGFGGKAAVKVNQESHFEAGIEIPDGGKAKGIATFDNKFILKEPPSFEVEGNIKIGGRLSFHLYGTDVGPYLDITPGLKLVYKENFGRQGTIKTELRGGLYTTAGIDLEWLGFKDSAVEISDLFHIDKVLWEKTLRESPADRAARENPTDCPDNATTTAAVADLEETTGAVGLRVTGRKCWRDWAVVDWVPDLYADRVSATVFKRKDDSLTPTVTMLGVDGPAGSSHNATCTKVKGMKVPAGLLDYLCPTSTGTSATAAFNPVSADVFASSGYVPTLSDTDLKALRGPVRAVQACGNCGPEGGDGSAQIIMLFYGNRYVGMVQEGKAYSFREVVSQNGTQVTSRVRWANPDDPVCCPSGDEVTYQHTWQNHQLQYTESVASGQ
ncbi:LppP/LprE family lipoprotein [Streptomyces albogriseolus]|uniref:LppP/LprE family lipoprotein n=1 Tax=Streptomyces albogriseolus TaxID=1887 RepID=UPI0022586C16|nr:LppP/LprE family lipoprotein [Streptomyces viridodiastaticus]MCX4564779.1 LppP/LprE family lipoprotein [Streptomyces viridodiastaticus]